MLILLSLLVSIQELQELPQSKGPKPLQIKEKPIQLDQNSIDEIKKIRDQLGIKLFDQSSEKEFEKNLSKLNKSAIKPLTASSTNKKSPLVEPKRPVYTPLNKGKTRHGTTLKTQTIHSMHNSVESLDRLALDLEKQGEFAQSKKLRKLSRQIRKQIQRMVFPRDN